MINVLCNTWILLLLLSFSLFLKGNVRFTQANVLYVHSTSPCKTIIQVFRIGWLLVLFLHPFIAPLLRVLGLPYGYGVILYTVCNMCTKPG